MHRHVRLIRVLALLLIAFLFIAPAAGLAQQTDQFRVDSETVDVFWNEDGTSSINYVYQFSIPSNGIPIDYVDVGIPTDSYDLNSVSADVDGTPVTDIGHSSTVKGVIVRLGSKTIQGGQSGTVHVFIGTVKQVLHPDDTDQNYASAVFIPNYFDPSYLIGTTDLTVRFHLPPGVQNNEPRWHASPSGWPEQPETALDDQDHILYTWRNQNASAGEAYTFGASFPAKYVPASAIIKPNPFAGLGNFVAGALLPLSCIGFFILIIILSVRGGQRRKLQYLPPRIAIEGHGIKRGLTAIEAATLMEEPLDKIMTMILFSVIKKNAASVVTRDPLKLQFASPLPEGLNDYETNFLAAFGKTAPAAQRKDLQDMTIKMVKSVAEKMKGFSRRETVDYYRNIIKQAWSQVESAGTPEVKSQKYDEVMEWTMLDHDYDRRTRDVFHTGPVFVPIWWGRYDPGFGRSTGPATTTTGGGSGGGVSMPTLPGSAFAGSIVGGVQNFSQSVIGNVTSFTEGITKTTNPPPPPSTSTYKSSGGGGGHCVCACACACAGCACACAGGGR